MNKTVSPRAMKKLLHIFECIILASLTSSCGTLRYQLPVKSWDAPPAILRNRFDTFLDSTIRLHKIDARGPEDYGKSGWSIHDTFNSKWNGKFEVVIAPGRHTLSVSFYDSRGTSYRTEWTSGIQTMSFIAVSGHSYVVESVILERKTKWKPIIIDETDEAHPQLVPVEYLLSMGMKSVPFRESESPRPQGGASLKT